MSTEIFLKRAEVLIDQERYDLAEKELRKLLAENPENADVVANLVRTLAAAAKNTEAQEWALKLLALDPNRSYFYYLAAFVEVRLLRLDQAEAHIRRAIELEPDWAMNFEVLSRIYQHRGKYEEGLQHANEGLRLEPDHIDCLDARAFSLAMLGHQAEARQTMDHALSLEPENPYLRRDIGVALSHLGDYHAAETHLRETLRLDPTSQDAKNQLYKTVLKKHRQHNRIYGIAQRVNNIPRWIPVKWLVYSTVATVLLAIFDNEQMIPGASVIGKIALFVLLLFLGGYIFWFLFQVLWVPVEILADVWLVTRSPEQHLFSESNRRPYYVQLACVVFLMLVVVGCLLWFGISDAHVPQSLAFAFLGLLTVRFVRTQK